MIYGVSVVLRAACTELDDFPIHEVLDGALLHTARRGTGTLGIWAKAGDIAVNVMAPEAELTLPEDTLDNGSRLIRPRTYSTVANSANSDCHTSTMSSANSWAITVSPVRSAM